MLIKYRTQVYIVITMVKVKCDYCGIIFNRPPCLLKKHVFCSVKCMGLHNTGENNPNYNNKWSDEKRRLQGKIISEKMNTDEIKFKCGSANRGKKFSVERIKIMHVGRSSESYSHAHTKETKKKIGMKSKIKFTDEYNKKFRTTMEEKGFWMPLKEKTDYQIYYEESNWKKQIFDNLSEKETMLFKKYGSWSLKNKTGLVRDHIYSRRSGCNNSVFTELLNHPCNCALITHTKNTIKQRDKKINSDGHTLAELFSKIKNYTGNWEEQEKCLKLIKEYESGKRWVRGC